MQSWQMIEDEQLGKIINYLLKAYMKLKKKIIETITFKIK
jgi:hypothetical protein